MHNQPDDIWINGFHYSRKELLRTKFDNTEISLFFEEWFNHDDFISINTSGSTGKPKNIPIKKEFMINSAVSTLQYIKIPKQKNFFVCLPLKYIGGKMMMVRGLLNEANIIIQEASSTPDLRNLTTAEFGAFTPHQLHNILSEQANELKRIKTLIIGGAPMSISLEKELLKLNKTAYETFGMTETISHIALRKIGEPYFHIIPPTTIDTTNQHELLISAPHLGIEKLKTNDLIEKIDENTFKWLGRKDFVINSGGIKIYPEHVEKILTSFLNPHHFFIGKLPDQVLGEKCVLFYLYSKFEKASLEKAVKEIETLYRPKELIPVKEILTTPTGKIDRLKTIEMYLQYLTDYGK